MAVYYNGKAVGLLIDNGHGYHTYMAPSAGKHSPDKSLYEGDWTREIVEKLVPDLTAIGFDCHIVVPELQDVPLRERVRRANDIAARNRDKAWYYVSIHINAAGSDGRWHNATGFSVFVSNKAGDESRRLARTMYEAADGMGLRGNRSVPVTKYWMANYTVITETSMPAILTENLFQDNRAECEFLKSDRGKDIITDVHVAGLCKYFGVPYSIKTQ